MFLPLLIVWSICAWTVSCGKETSPAFSSSSLSTMSAMISLVSFGAANLTCSLHLFVDVDMLVTLVRGYIQKIFGSSRIRGSDNLGSHSNALCTWMTSHDLIRVKRLNLPSIRWVIYQLTKEWLSPARKPVVPLLRWLSFVLSWHCWLLHEGQWGEEARDFVHSSGVVEKNCCDQAGTPVSPGLTHLVF